MSRTLNLSLTDELRAFIDEQSGQGTTYATPSEYVRAVLREKKEREEAAALRAGVLAGYDDVRAGRTTQYTGDLKQMLRKRRAKR
ncbi:MAG: type II toxin-antitoxin system ParD family antitoxin [Phycisphaeraceae bacterium]